jgi:hypothetical protein
MAPKIGTVIVAFAVALIHQAAAQGTLTVETNKSEYGLGEVIEISVTLVNNTQSFFQLTGSSSCQAGFILDGFDAGRNTVCTADFITIDFNPGSWRKWTWQVDPQLLGLPVRDGSHTIVGYYPGTALADTIGVVAPRSVGGRLSVSIQPGVTQADVAQVVDSLGATILRSDVWPDGHRTEEWQISGVNVDDAAASFGGDPRFISMEPVRLVYGAHMTAIHEPKQLPIEPVLISVYPNPCRTSCFADVRVPSPQQIVVRVYDIAGRILSSFSEFVVTGNSPQRLQLDTSDLASGAYLVAITGSEFTSTSTLTVVR